MKDNEQIFGSYTIRQVSMIEAEYFVIRFDGDFFNEDGYLRCLKPKKSIKV